MSHDHAHHGHHGHACSHDHGHGHSHGGHGHHHGPASYDRAFAIGIALNIGFVLVEAVYGWMSGSLALLLTSAHAPTPSHPALPPSAPPGEELLEWRHLQSHDVPLISPRVQWLLAGGQAGVGAPQGLSLRAQPCHHLCLNAAAERAFVQNRPGIGGRAVDGVGGLCH